MPHPSQQLTLEDIGQPLHETTFVVVDLETTGGAPGRDAITEIGAVKVCGGEVLGELATLVDPRTAIDPYVQVLTGITDSMVRGAPTIEAVLPTFLEFAGLGPGTVLVAHNARFDVGFLRAAATSMGLSWPRHPVLDTVQLARKTLARGEVPNLKLETLAMHLGSRTRPVHRALDDARATTDVMHHLLERVGSLGVHTTEELLALTRESTPAQRGKRHLAEDLPTGPGVYIFRDARGEALYVGKSGQIRRRVRSYFTSSEPRARMREMVALTERVEAVECAHDLEAQVRELRLIHALRPRYNRRSKHGRSAVWLRVTDERFPRLSIVNRWRADGGAHIGPFSSRTAAGQAVDAIHEVLPIRRCSDRITSRSAPSPCALLDLGRCAAPCTGGIDVDSYSALLAPITEAALRDPQGLVTPLLARIDQLAGSRRYEDAAAARDRTRHLVAALIRTQQIHRLAHIDRLVLAAPAEGGCWQIAVIARGRLVAAALADRAASVLPIVRALRPAEQHTDDDPAEAVGFEHEETQLLWRWMTSAGARIVELDGELSSPAAGAARWQPWLRRAARQAGNTVARRGYDRPSTPLDNEETP
ncbi:DEDD exonuclease domain-containing protein [Blastococcus sp. Marseille-P5729]|uniref:DEDD exonuclease domain-containing protein n=1 Tax=Blastococcus sp. Marseille-P5729 TaxID=2086582 RepID=UPI001F4736B7|nr:DEDD exonuclease domain-containing protein [Blastococcus sp. Marseille-P5729]